MEDPEIWIRGTVIGEASQGRQCIFKSGGPSSKHEMRHRELKPKGLRHGGVLGKGAAYHIPPARR